MTRPSADAPVGVIDYGVGNLRSVTGAIERLGHRALVSADPAVLAEAGRLVLPGVGAFGLGMENLRSRGLVPLLERLVREEHRPIFGICLGAHLFAKAGHEFGRHEGLGWIDAEVMPLTPTDGLRVPHVGWNEARPVRASLLFDDVPADALFYYVHSYRLVCGTSELVTAECEYGEVFPAAFQCDNLYGTQFHPEKSQRHGLTLLRNFLERA
jgi:glutamine amidotransferase